MVSLLSLFGVKRKQRTARPLADPANGSGSTANGVGSRDAPGASDGAGPTRLPNGRSKPSGKPYDSANRHASSQTANGQNAKSKPYQLPKLDLGFPTGSEGSGPGMDGLKSGLEDVASVPVLSGEEVQALNELRFSCEEVKEGWEMLSAALKQLGYDQQDLLHPRPDKEDQGIQRHVLALLALCIMPSSAKVLPTVARRFASDASPASLGSAYRESFTLHVTSLSDLQICACLRWFAHRLRPNAANPAEPLIAAETYASFVREEGSAGYPPDAYDTRLRMMCHSGKLGMLDEVFDTLAAIVTRAEENGMTLRATCLLLGWWLLALEEAEVHDGWAQLHAAWEEAGKRAEHLFLCWIRSQSERTILPSRLVDLVTGYPFSASETPATFKPRLPDSIAPRTTLWVDLITHADSWRTKTPDPLTLLEGAVAVARGEKNSQLALLLEEMGVGHRNDAAVWLAERSRIYVGASKANRPDSSAGQRTAAVQTIEAQAFNQRMTQRQRQDASVNDHKSNLGAANAGGPDTAAESRRSRRIPPPTVDIGNDPFPRTSTQSSAWDDFSTAGFADDSEKRKRKLSLGPDAAVFRPPFSNLIERQRPGSGEGKAEVPAEQSSIHETLTEAHFEGEGSISIEETFISFVEDSHLDPAACSASRPRFAIFRLATPVSVVLTGDKPTTIDAILVSLKYQRPPSPQPSAVPLAATPEEAVPTSFERPTQPRKSFASGLRGLSFGRRPSLSPNSGSRRSFFGSIPRTRASAPPERVRSFEQAARMTGRTDGSESDTRHSTAPFATTEAPMDEFRQLLRHDSTAGATTKEDSAPGQNVQQSSVEEWRFLAEGGLHLVFKYVGTDERCQGRVLRVRKGDAGQRSAAAAASVWQDRLLPRLVSPDLLLSTTEADFSSDWLSELVKRSESDRSSHRLSSGEATVSRASLMENLLDSGDRDEAETVLMVEIKPKWGFLPDEQYIQPPEARPIKSQIDRYTLHQSLKRSQGKMSNAYCPIDLYSGDPDRMLKALGDLWEGWQETGGEGNNWRVHVDGKAIHPSDLTRIPKASSGSLAEATAPFVLPLLEESKVLEQLKTLQQQLDPTDISDLAQRFRASHPDRTIFDPEILPELTADELEDFVQMYLADPPAGKQEQAWSDRQRHIAWSLSAIFKDCSIMIRSVLEPGPEGHYTLKEDKSKVNLVDLDLKPLKLKKWYELDEQIWRHWLDSHPPRTGEQIAESSKTANGIAPNATAQVSAAESAYPLQEAGRELNVSTATVPAAHSPGQATKESIDDSLTGQSSAAPAVHEIDLGTPTEDLPPAIRPELKTPETSAAPASLLAPLSEINNSVELGRPLLESTTAVLDKDHDAAREAMPDTRAAGVASRLDDATVTDQQVLNDLLAIQAAAGPGTAQGSPDEASHLHSDDTVADMSEQPNESPRRGPA